MNMYEKDTSGLTQSNRFLKRSYNRFLIPTMLISLGTTLNIFFDGIIVGCKLGSDSFTAVNLCMPIYLIICTIGSLIGSGGFILSSHAIGNGDIKKSNCIFNTSSVMMIVVALLVTFVGLCNLSYIVSFLADDGNLNKKVYSYALITISGTLPKMFLYLPLFYLRLEGKSKWASIVTFIMTVSNIVLDLLFICVCNMGIGGAAYASVISTILACIAGMYALSKCENFHFSSGFEKITIIPEILRYGSPAAINNLMSALRILLLNAIIIHNKGVEFISVFSVLNNINEISLCIVSGVPNTAEPIIGIYYAEQSNEGIRILMKHQLKTGLILSSVFGAIIFILSDCLGSIYGVSYPMHKPVLCLSFAIILMCMCQIIIGFYNASGKNILADVLIALKLVVFPTIILKVIIRASGYVWMFMPLGELCTLLFLLVIIAGIHIKNPERSPLLLLNDKSIHDGNALEFSVDSDDNDICSASEKIRGFCNMNNISEKRTMRISLAIEEILTVMSDKCFYKNKKESFDLRIFANESETGMRVRCLGKHFNPVAGLDNEYKFDDSMGIRMIVNMAKKVEYNYIFGTNNLLIII